MTRTLTLTPAEWEALQRDRTTWIVREGGFAQTSEAFHDDINPRCRKNAHVPPAELVAAAAPCKRCDGARNLWWPGSDRSAPCGDCRITLVGECPTCMGSGCVRGGYPDYDALDCSACSDGTVTLGYAYADSEVLPCVDDPDSVGEAACIHVESAHVAWHWKAGEPDEYAETDISAELAHYGDLRDLVGRYALKVRLA